MNRTDWLKLKRHEIEERYDRLWAPIYDKNWGADIDPIHAGLITHLVKTCPATGSILDAACGTGKYWPILIGSGRRFTGIDQSRAMLDRATRKYPQVRVKKFGLQEMNFQDAFDLILCMDAMEMVFPEDWLKVLANFQRALKPAGQLYFTVEIAEQDMLDRDYQAGIDLGLPVVFGESVFSTGDGADEGGYHYYPSMDQVREWISVTGFTIKVEAESNDYHHFWVEKK
jgi:SAM-dependent methyltransferase